MTTKRKKTITSTTRRWNDVDLVDVFERGKKEGARLQKEEILKLLEIWCFKDCINEVCIKETKQKISELGETK